MKIYLAHFWVQVLFLLHISSASLNPLPVYSISSSFHQCKRSILQPPAHLLPLINPLACLDWLLQLYPPLILALGTIQIGALWYFPLLPVNVLFLQLVMTLTCQDSLSLTLSFWIYSLCCAGLAGPPGFQALDFDTSFQPASPCWWPYMTSELIPGWSLASSWKENWLDLGSTPTLMTSQGGIRLSGIGVVSTVTRERDEHNAHQAMPSLHSSSWMCLLIMSTKMLHGATLKIM